MDEKKYPKKIEFNPQNVKKEGQNGGTSISPNIEGVPSPGSAHRARLQVTTIPAKSTWLTAHSWLPSRNEEIRIYRKLPQSDV